MRVHVVDPPAYTPPYDRALCAALAARADLEVTLVTSAFRHGEVPAATGYRVDERFYAGRGPRAARHVPDMLAYRRAAAAEADVVHFQWAAVQEVDWALMPARPLVVTAHDVLPRQARPLQRAGQKRVYARADAVVVHTERGRDRLRAQAGVPDAKIAVIPHGAFTHLRGVIPQQPPELSAGPPAVLFAGLIRPYKGLEDLYAAWPGIDDAQLWVVGAPRMELPDPPPGVTVVPRFVTEGELAWSLLNAAVVVLPYREIEQSGVLFSALGLQRPVLVSDAFAEPDLPRFPAGDVESLTIALRRMLAEPVVSARAPASWDDIADQHAALYARLTA